MKRRKTRWVGYRKKENIKDRVGFRKKRKTRDGAGFGPLEKN